MTKKTTPRWGWNPEWDQGDLNTRLARIDFRRLAVAVGVKGDAALSRFERDYEIALSMYHFISERIGDVSGTEIKNTLGLVSKRAAPLLDALDNLNQFSRMVVQEQLAEHSDLSPDTGIDENGIPYGPYRGEVEYDQIAKGLQRLLTAVDDALSAMQPTRAGRKPNDALSRLITDLADIYEEHSGTQADKKHVIDSHSGEYGGPFFLFLEETLAAFRPDKPISNNALGEAIRRALGKR